MATKKKPLTKREKALNAQVKKDLQEHGILPPDKPKLNRKKFVTETWVEFNEFLKVDPMLAGLRLLKAIGCMIGPDMMRVTSEEVGVAKLLKLAVEIDKFMKAREVEGRSEYTFGELVDEVILPITKR